MYLSGLPGQPSKAYVPYVDYGTALAAALGAMGALRMRERTGRGQQVDASLLATALAFAGSPLAEQAARSKDRVGTGNRGQVYGPSDVFHTRDGSVLVQVIGRPLFERWARLVGAPEWLSDPRFATDEGRGDHAEVLGARMARWCAERTRAEALDALAAARIPAAPVLSPQECLDHPQVQAAAVLRPTEYPGLSRPVPVAGMPFRLAAGESASPRRAPTLGEHTDDILLELGYRPETIRELHRMGSV
jgi:crotonobetainyl-CoA:carnitine CoA-transferase CaiB-like acyl-CoA transferase